MRISKYKNSFAKVSTPNWSEQVFMILKVKNSAPWRYIISDLKVEKIVGTFHEKELQETSQTEFKIEKVTREKAINCTPNGRAMVNHSIPGLIEQI